jgi:hypothetical protein
VPLPVCECDPGAEAREREREREMERERVEGMQDLRVSTKHSSRELRTGGLTVWGLGFKIRGLTV